jgi:plastocyanin
MSMNRLISIAVLAAFSMGASSVGRVVHQKGRMFSTSALTVERGEPILFLNDDTVPHNVMSTTPEDAFDLGSQSPGHATPVSFDIAGTVVVICAIHPRMHMTITVND